MRIIKKVIGYFFLIEFIVSVYLAFTEMRVYPFAALLTCSFFGIIAFLLLRPKKKKDIIQQPVPDVVNVTPKTPETNCSQETRASMQHSYSFLQGQNDIRILNDCINLMQSTKNLETFFSRYELAMQTVMNLEQARAAGITIDTTITPDYIMSLRSRADYVLQATYNSEIEKINALKTSSGKLKRIDRFIDFLSEYEDEFEFSDTDTYRNIMHNLILLKNEYS